MPEQDFDLWKKVARLEAENESLSSQLAELTEAQKSKASDEIFQAARKRLITWVAGVTVLFTVFGFVSISQIIDGLEKVIVDKGEEYVVKQVVDSFEQKYKNEMSSRVISTLRPEIKSDIDKETTALIADTEQLVTKEVERRVREQMFAFVNTLEQAEQPTAEEDREATLSSAIQKTYEGKRYAVIAASSVRRQDVESELERVKRKVGPTFDEQFPNASVWVPYPGTSHYPLILGGGLTYQEAEALRKRAIEAGFRDDTFLWLEKGAAAF